MANPTAESCTKSVHRPAWDTYDIGGGDASRGCRVLMSILGLVTIEEANRLLQRAERPLIVKGQPTPERSVC